MKTLLILAAALCIGCVATEPKVQVPPAQCDVLCVTACEVPELIWTGDPAAGEAWDRLIEDVLMPLREAAERCEAHRLACDQCLTRLEEADAVCGFREKCSD